MLQVFTSNPIIQERLSRRTGMTVEPGPELLHWVDDSGWSRRVSQSSGTEQDLGQVVELIDNNPLVCADKFDLTPPAGGMASLLLGPLLLVGMKPIVTHCKTNFNPGVEAHFFALDFPVSEPSTETALGPRADILTMEIHFSLEPGLLEQEVFSTIEERLGRSFFVRTSYGSQRETSFSFPEAECSWVFQENEWVARAGCYRDGKFGWAGILHAFNVMVGAEESSSLEF